MTAYYKAVRPNGRDFYTDTVDYGAALLSGEPVMAPHWDRKAGAAGYLSVSVEPADWQAHREFPAFGMAVGRAREAVAKLEAGDD